VVRDERDRVIGIVETVTDITELEKARQKAEEANQLLTEHYRLYNLIGQSRAMQEVFHRLRAAAESRVNVLIQGESGTGKEVIANAIHYNSGQAEQPLVRVNCSALSETLLESELFGHARGAFTGAIRDRRGRFEEAHGGSIFLDEIGELSPAIQIKLLRVLQEREIERVGESSPRRVDIRVITATNHDLDQLVAQGRFRQDLYYRLKVFPITVPALRHRREDIPFLVDHFIRQQAELTGKPVHGAQRRAMRLLLEHNWPGNVRELENAVQHAFVLCDRDLISPEDLPGEIRGEPERPSAGALEARPRRASDALEREQLERLLRECGWNKAEVARRLNMSRTAIWKYMKRWGIPLRDPEAGSR
jgi:transcriptional regulator with PAS, ATPase and Fis domain